MYTCIFNLSIFMNRNKKNIFWGFLIAVSLAVCAFCVERLHQHYINYNLTNAVIVGDSEATTHYVNNGADVNNTTY